MQALPRGVNFSFKVGLLSANTDWLYKKKTSENLSHKKHDYAFQIRKKVQSSVLIHAAIPDITLSRRKANGWNQNSDSISLFSYTNLEYWPTGKVEKKPIDAFSWPLGKDS